MNDYTPSIPYCQGDIIAAKSHHIKSCKTKKGGRTKRSQRVFKNVFIGVYVASYILLGSIGFLIAGFTGVAEILEKDIDND